MTSVICVNPYRHLSRQSVVKNGGQPGLLEVMAGATPVCGIFQSGMLGSSETPEAIAATRQLLGVFRGRLRLYRPP
jgi:hypothetical protein